MGFREVTIRELRNSVSEKTLKEMFVVTSRKKKLGVWYPGDDSVIKALLKSIVSLNKATNVLINLPYGIKGEIVENPLDEELCEKCGGGEYVVEHWEDGDKHMICEYCLGKRKRT